MRVGVVDFFSGCGGASTGFAKASVPGVQIEVVAGLDNDPSACATFEQMHNAPSYCLDIAELQDDPSELDALSERWGLRNYDRIVLIGCAPCQGFAAHRKAVNGTDARRHLFPIFSEIAARLQPDAIFMENVPDLFSKKHWRYYETGRQVLTDNGYRVRGRIYNFADFGLPQERFRAVMLAMKEDFAMPIPPLSASAHSTVRHAIAHLPALQAGEVSSSDPMHRTSKHRESTLEILRQIPLDGGNRPVGVGPICLDRARERHGGYTDVYGRLAWDRPSVTITARCRTPSCGRFTHPEQHRGLSIREAALLQGFPEDFSFEGNFDDKYKQIGNAVPPLVATQFAEHLIRLAKGLKPQLETDSEDIEAPVGPGFAVKINGIKRRRQRAAEELQGA